MFHYLTYRLPYQVTAKDVNKTHVCIKANTSCTKARMVCCCTLFGIKQITLYLGYQQKLRRFPTRQTARCGRIGDQTNTKTFLQFLCHFCLTLRLLMSYIYMEHLNCWNRGFESHRGHGYLSVVSVVCCQVEVSATNWSLVQRSPTDCAASLCAI